MEVPPVRQAGQVVGAGQPAGVGELGDLAERQRGPDDDGQDRAGGQCLRQRRDVQAGGVAEQHQQRDGGDSARDSEQAQAGPLRGRAASLPGRERGQQRRHRPDHVDQCPVDVGAAGGQQQVDDVGSGRQDEAQPEPAPAPAQRPAQRGQRAEADRDQQQVPGRVGEQRQDRGAAAGGGGHHRPEDERRERRDAERGDERVQRGAAPQPGDLAPGERDDAGGLQRVGAEPEHVDDVRARYRRDVEPAEGVDVVADRASQHARGDQQPAHPALPVPRDPCQHQDGGADDDRVVARVVPPVPVQQTPVQHQRGSHWDQADSEHREHDADRPRHHDGAVHTDNVDLDARRHEPPMGYPARRRQPTRRPVRSGPSGASCKQVLQHVAPGRTELEPVRPPRSRGRSRAGPWQGHTPTRPAVKTSTAATRLAPHGSAYPRSAVPYTTRWHRRLGQIALRESSHRLLQVTAVAEADGNRTRQDRLPPLTGFEDRGAHQERVRLPATGHATGPRASVGLT